MGGVPRLTTGASYRRCRMKRKGWVIRGRGDDGKLCYVGTDGLYCGRAQAAVFLTRRLANAERIYGEPGDEWVEKFPKVRRRRVAR